MVKADLQRLAAAKALEWGQARGAVAAVKVDGAQVALADAQQTLEEVNRQLTQAPAPNRVDRWVDKLEGRVKSLEEKVSTQQLGKKIVDALGVDHERVAKQVQVDVAFADGHTEKVTIEVVDVPTTVLLNRLSAAAEVIALTPMVGPGFAFITAVSASAGAKISEWQGKPELAEALQRTALKQWVLAGVGWVPGLSSAVGAMAVVRDWHDQREAALGPPVSVIA